MKSPAQYRERFSEDMFSATPMLGGEDKKSSMSRTVRRGACRMDSRSPRREAPGGRATTGTNLPSASVTRLDVRNVQFEESKGRAGRDWARGSPSGWGSLKETTSSCGNSYPRSMRRFHLDGRGTWGGDGRISIESVIQDERRTASDKWARSLPPGSAGEGRRMRPKSPHAYSDLSTNTPSLCIN